MSSSAASVSLSQSPAGKDPSVALRWHSFIFSPAWMFAVGLVVRVAVIVVAVTAHLYKVPWGNFEMANIGHSLAIGQGFASPFGGSTGPTAWTAPIYPWVIALVFRIFGIFSIGSAFALLTFNSIFSALTCWTIYRIALRLFNANAAVWSGWLWALNPLAVFFSVVWIWETSLSAFLLSLVFMLTMEMEGDTRSGPWLRYGLVWGLIALTNPALLAWLPFSGCWLAYRLHRAGKRFLVPVTLSVIVFWTVITPWLVRNYIVFDRMVFIRTTLGSNLRAGNNPQAYGRWVVEYTYNNPLLFAQYRRLGEFDYDAQQGQAAKSWMEEDPKRTLLLTCRRFFLYWYGVPETPLPRLGHLLYFGLTIASVGGLLLTFVRRLPGAFLFGTLMVSYPLIYYITFAMMRYRHPIEPALVILAGLLMASMVDFIKSRMMRPEIQSSA